VFLARLSLLHTRIHHPQLQSSPKKYLYAPARPSASFGLVMSESQVQTQVAAEPSAAKVVLRYEQVPETTYDRMSQVLPF
jgi:hypothetical protein